MPKAELERIAKALESIADSLNKLSNPPILMGERLPDDANILPGGLTYVRTFLTGMKTQEKADAR